MRKEVRERAFTPIMLPVTILGSLLLFTFSLSRVLLAVSAVTAALVAMLLAGYILALAFLMEARRRISSSSLAIAVGVGLIGVLAAGAAASIAGIRLVGSEAGPAAAAPGGGAETAGTEGGAIHEGELFVADDIFYEKAPETVPAGDLTFVLENRGGIKHNVAIEEIGDRLIVEAEGDETATGTVTLDPGEYTYYCSIPGHREQGMEGTLTVE